MKSIIFFIFTAFLGAILSGCGGGGGGGGNLNNIPEFESPVVSWVNSDIRQFIQAEDPDLFAKIGAQNGWVELSLTRAESDSFDEIYLKYLRRPNALYRPIVGGELAIPGLPIRRIPFSYEQYIPIALERQHGISVVLNRSANYVFPNGVGLEGHDRNIFITGSDSVGIYPIVIGDLADSGKNLLINITLDIALIEDGNVIYLATYCGSYDNPSRRCRAIRQNSRPVSRFVLPPGVYSTEDTFRFNRGLIRNAHSFGNFHINAENKHAEYRWTPYSDVFVDYGFRRFGNADVAYAKMQMDYKDFYLQYMAGNIRSDYYQEGNINGVAVGWQKNGFAIKAEKPFGNGGEKTVRLFYQREF